MGFVSNFPLFTIIISFVGVVLASVLKNKAARISTIVVESAALILSLFVLIFTVKTGTFERYSMGHFPAPFDNEIRFGILEGILAVFAVSLILLSNIAGGKYAKEDISDGKRKYLYVLLNLAQVALVSLIYTNDIFTGYVFLEISTLSSVGLVAIREKGHSTLAAIRYLIFNLIGSGLFLLGCVLLYDMTGYLSMEYIKDEIAAILASGGASYPLTAICIALIGIGLGIKSGMCPFYFWMGDVYTESTLSSSMVVSGLISKGYIILIIKFVYRVFGLECFVTTDMNLVFLFLGILGMIFGSVTALRQKRVSRMIAFSSAAQMGYIYMGIGLGAAGMTAAVFQILAHGLTKAMLFASCRLLTDASDGLDDFDSIKGAGRRNIAGGIAFSAGALSMVGIPGFAGFMTKILFMKAVLPDGKYMGFVIAALVISTLLNISYYLRTVITIYLPSCPGCGKRAILGNVPAAAASLVFLALNVVIGVTPIVSGLISSGLLMF